MERPPLYREAMEARRQRMRERGERVLMRPTGVRVPRTPQQSNVGCQVTPGCVLSRAISSIGVAAAQM